MGRQSFEKAKEEARENKISPHLLKKIENDLGLELKVGRVIAELKGGGIISPCLRESIRTGTIQYEINPSLYEKLTRVY